MEQVKNLDCSLDNPSGYRKRHVRKAINGTGEAILVTFPRESKAETYKYEVEVNHLLVKLAG